MSPAETPDAKQPVHFEQALAALEAIVRDLEDGELGLNDSLARYEEGVRLLKQCHGLLERAERRIELLAGVDAAGNPLAEPFEDAGAEPLEEKASARSRRRSRSAEPRRAAEKPARDDLGETEPGGSLFD